MYAGLELEYCSSIDSLRYNNNYFKIVICNKLWWATWNYVMGRPWPTSPGFDVCDLYSSYIYTHVNQARKKTPVWSTNVIISILIWSTTSNSKCWMFFQSYRVPAAGSWWQLQKPKHSGLKTQLLAAETMHIISLRWIVSRPRLELLCM